MLNVQGLMELARKRKSMDMNEYMKRVEEMEKNGLLHPQLASLSKQFVAEVIRHDKIMAQKLISYHDEEPHMPPKTQIEMKKLWVAAIGM